MREALIVMRRELRSYFCSPLAYVFGSAFLLLQLYVSTVLFGVISDGARADMTAFFRLLPLVYIVFLPALSMRSWAEERKSGTLELLLTFPARASSLICGKFVATVAFVALLLCFTLPLPLTLDAHADLDWQPVIGGYLASLLLASAYLAVGMFFSSMTRDQLVAMLTSFFTLAILVVPATSWGGLVLESAGLPADAVRLLAWISPFAYFESISRGVLDLGDVVYYAAFCGFFLYLNALVLRARRQNG